MPGRGWPWVRRLAGVAILAVLVWRVGTGPFLDGLRHVDARAVGAAVALNLVATIGCAWRWSLVARGLGVGLPLPSAVAAYYRSQFLNTVLPGGVLGDVHRGVAHGRGAGSVGRGLRAVGWERAAGQAVQIALAALVLLVLPSPVRTIMPAALVAAAALVAIGVWLGRRGPGWLRGDLRAVLSAGPGVVLASVVMVACHVATFLIAARTAGVPAGIATLLPLAVLVLLAMSVPLNVGGWGPREGVAAWAFAAAGLGAADGVATAVVYGVLAFAAALPGALVLIANRPVPELVAATRG